METGTPADVDRPGAGPAAPPPQPADGECLFCYVDRVLSTHGCDTTLRWVQRWRDLRAPGAQGLERRLGSRGGFCDCEVFLNGWTLREELQVPGEDGELTWPVPRPPCAGARPRSTLPCSNWEPWRRPRW